MRLTPSRPPGTCRCGRPICTGDDLARWQREIDEFGKAGGDCRRFNPEWAKAICWSTTDSCPMKPLNKDATDAGRRKT